MAVLGVQGLVILLIVSAVLAYGVKRSRGPVRVLAIIALAGVCLAILFELFLQL